MLSYVEDCAKKAVRKGRGAFRRGSDEYAHGSLAVLNLGVLTDSRGKRLYADHISALTDDEIKAIVESRNRVAHAGYKRIGEERLWNEVNSDIPGYIAKLRATLRHTSGA